MLIATFYAPFDKLATITNNNNHEGKHQNTGIYYIFCFLQSNKKVNAISWEQNCFCQIFNFIFIGKFKPIKIFADHKVSSVMARSVICKIYLTNVFLQIMASKLKNLSVFMHNKNFPCSAMKQMLALLNLHDLKTILIGRKKNRCAHLYQLPPPKKKKQKQKTNKQSSAQCIQAL